MILAEQIINSGVTLFTIGGVIYGIHLGKMYSIPAGICNSRN